MRVLAGGLNENTCFLDAKPTFMDVNGDGLEDLIVGTRFGRLRYLKNIGQSISPKFKEMPDNENPFPQFVGKNPTSQFVLARPLLEDVNGE